MQLSTYFSNGNDIGAICTCPTCPGYGLSTVNLACEFKTYATALEGIRLQELVHLLPHFHTVLELYI